MEDGVWRFWEMRGESMAWLILPVPMKVILEKMLFLDEDEEASLLEVAVVVVEK